MRELKQGTASNLMVFMASITDHVAGATGLTLAIAASKDGAAFASITPPVTERGNGWYALALTTSHTDTLGDLAFHLTAAGADPSDLVARIVANVEADTFARVGANGAGLTALGDARLGNLDATIGSRAPATTALSTAVWTSTKADFLDAAISSVSTGGVSASDIAAAVATRIATDHGSGSYVRNTEPDNSTVAAIKAKTDNLPAAFPANFASLAITAGGLASINLAQTGLSPRALDSVADASLTVGDGLVSAICGAAGKESTALTTYLVKTPSTGTTIRAFTLDDATTPTSRT